MSAVNELHRTERKRHAELAESITNEGYYMAAHCAAEGYHAASVY